MKKQTKTSMKYFRSFGIALLVIGISIGAYGIFRAPSSDASQLENELMQNERELEKEEATPAYAAAKTPAATKKQTAAPRVPDIHESSITVIGDSVFLGAAPSFKKLYKSRHRRKGIPPGRTGTRHRQKASEKGTARRYRDHRTRHQRKL